MRDRLLLLLLATILQFHYLTQDMRFHPDEAYFMTFARNAAVNGDWMLSGSLDKPPLSIYLSALSMTFVGVTTDANGVLQLDPHLGEFAGRLPNALFAILLVAVMMRLADDLYHTEAITIFSGLLTATSPYMLAFGATAFTDMSLLFWLVLSLWLTVKRRWIWAGLALGLAFWSKQQAIFYVPLIMFFLYFVHRRGEARLLRKTARPFMIGGLILVALLLLWDAARPETSLFLLGSLNNAPDTLLATASQFGTRLLNWTALGAWLVGYPWMTLIAVIMVMMGGAWHLFRRETTITTDVALALFVISYVALHTIVAFNQYDRYLLLILPSLILLTARGVNGFLEFALRYGGGERGFVMLGLASVLFTVSTGIPIGGNSGKYTGIDDLADYLNDKPIATVIYDRWLGWELGYYMGQWTNKRRVYYPTPQALVTGALALDEIGERYFVAPENQPVQAWLTALENAGFTTELDYEIARFRVYRLSVPASDA